ARVVAELELLLVLAELAGELGGAARAERELVHVQVQHVAALRGLRRIRRVLDEAREVLEQAQIALNCEQLLVEAELVRVRLERWRRRIARGAAALAALLARVARAMVAVVQADPPGAVVVVGQEARRVKMRGVGLRRDAIRTARAEPALVLSHGRS